MSFEDHTHTVTDKRAVILLSGGLDSTVCAALAKRMGWKLWALSIDYGQRHDYELACANAQGVLLGCEAYRLVKVTLPFTSALLGTDEFKMRTLEEIRAAEQASPAFLPGRNLIFLAIAAAWAQTLDIQHVLIGATIEDQVGFKDCRPEFFAAAAPALGVEIHAPLVQCRKLDVVEMALKWPEVILERTSSCYQPDLGRACGRCDPCVIRLDAFEKLGAKDPIPYRWQP